MTNPDVRQALAEWAESFTRWGNNVGRGELVKLSPNLCHSIAADIRAALAEQPASAPEGWQLVPKEPTQGMVDAYLKANDAYWKAADQLAPKLGTWRQGTPRQATTVSLAAAFAAAPKPEDTK